MKIIPTTDSQPVSSSARAPIAESAPPYTHIGATEVGVTGFWSPPHDMMLVNGYVTSRTLGTATAGWVFLKKSFLTPEGEILGEVRLGAGSQKAIFTFDNSYVAKIISPYDQLYIASFAASGHTDITIQFFAERVG